MTDVRGLSVHAGYRCRHSGACCTAGWPIPIEADRLNAVRAALASGALRPAAAGVDPLVLTPDAPAPAVVATTGRACVFYDTDGRCRIHAALGHDALPLACRQFPRISVIDPRGVSVTLSHYCPTARALLERDGPLVIASDAFPAGEYVGLDATSSLPPLLRPDVLMDWDSWWEWERLAVARIAEARGTPAETLDSLAGAVEHARAWRPGDGPLLDRIRDAFRVPASSRPMMEAGPSGPAKRNGSPSEPRPRSAGATADAILAAIPADLRRAAEPAGPRPSDGVIRRYLAAHAFANWTAHLGQGLRSWLASVSGALTLVDAGYGLGDADLVLRHLADTEALTRLWCEAERE